MQTDNLSELPTFLKNIGSNNILRNREFVFTPKIEYEMAAERSEAASSGLRFSKVSPREESNPDYRNRNPVSYPLNDEGITYNPIFLATISTSDCSCSFSARKFIRRDLTSKGLLFSIDTFT